MKFPSNLNCDGKIVSEMGPRWRYSKLSTRFHEISWRFKYWVVTIYISDSYESCESLAKTGRLNWIWKQEMFPIKFEFKKSRYDNKNHTCLVCCSTRTPSEIAKADFLEFLVEHNTSLGDFCCYTPSKSRDSKHEFGVYIQTIFNGQSSWYM